MDFFKNRIYLDYVSSTPVDIDMMASFPVLPREIVMANPSALHTEGQAAKQALIAARQLSAKTLGAHEDEIIFTATATESDNIALQGTVHALVKKNKSTKGIVLMTTDSEHAAVVETTQALAEQITTLVLPTEQGVLDPKTIVVPGGTTALIVSVMYVNNEIGVVQDIVAIAKRIRFLRKQFSDIVIIFHIDATQAPLHYSLQVQKLGIDMMTLGATKLYCPKGVGLLYVKRNTAIVPVIYGGGQEFGLRPGTQAVQLIHDFAYALQYAQKNSAEYSEKIRVLQNHFERLITEHIPHAVITAKTVARTPHLSHIAIKGFDSELLVLELDARGIAVSAKSACKNEETNESGMIERIYGQGWGAIRFSFGRMTTTEDVENTVIALQKVLEKYL